MSVKEQDNKYAIDVADVTKVYRLYEKPIDRLKESMSISHKNYHRDYESPFSFLRPTIQSYHYCPPGVLP